MIHNNRIIGIDLIKTDTEGGVYGIFESYNEGKDWCVVTQSRTIESLINFAKLKYEKSTPMIMTEQIDQLLRYEFISEKEKNKIQQKEQKNIKMTWIRKLITFFKKEFYNDKKMWRRNKQGH